MSIQLFTDGGSRGNPGPAACAFVVQEGTTVVSQGSKLLGVMTNNEAEYQGFLLSLKWLIAALQTNTTYTRAEWQLDSKLVVEQLNRRWKIKEPRMRLLASECWKSLNSLSIPYSISHIPREKNALADALLNQTLDSAV